MNIQFKLLDRRFLNNEVELPCYKSASAAGIDLRLMNDPALPNQGDITLYPGDSGLYPAGFSYQLDTWFDSNQVMGLIVPRSSLGLKGLILQNTVGIIDSDYQGPLMLALRNIGFEPLRIKNTERIAQLIFVNISRSTSFSIVEDFSKKTVRGEGGLGSTGST